MHSDAVLGSRLQANGGPGSFCFRDGSAGKVVRYPHTPLHISLTPVLTRSFSINAVLACLTRFYGWLGDVGDLNEAGARFGGNCHCMPGRWGGILAAASCQWFFLVLRVTEKGQTTWQLTTARDDHGRSPCHVPSMFACTHTAMCPADQRQGHRALPD